MHRTRSRVAMQIALEGSIEFRRALIVIQAWHSSSSSSSERDLLMNVACGAAAHWLIRHRTDLQTDIMLSSSGCKSSSCGFELAHAHQLHPSSQRLPSVFINTAQLYIARTMRNYIIKTMRMAAFGKHLRTSHFVSRVTVGDCSRGLFFFFLLTWQ